MSDANHEASAAFDRRRIERLIGDLGEEDVRELIVEFIAQMHGWVGALRDLPLSPRKPLLELAHAIGSSASMLGALPLEHAARALEHHTGSDEAMRSLREDVVREWSRTEREALTLP